jgi:uncharacterized membrane protein
MGTRLSDRTVWPLWLTVGIALSLALRVWSVWPELPDTMASHFGPSGRADAFMSKESFFLVMLLLGGGSVAAVFAGPTLMRHLPPSLVSVPNADYWLASDERREVAIDRVAGLLGWVGMSTAALLAVTIELVVQANPHQTNLDNSTFLVVLGAYFGFVIAVVVRKIQLLKLPK